MKTIQEYSKLIHSLNKEKWWKDAKGNSIERNKGELLMLAISELSEAMEGIRKGLMDDKLPHRSMEEVEMADCFIRLCDFAGGFNIDLDFNFNHTSCAFIKAEENKPTSILIICGNIYKCYEHSDGMFIKLSIDNIIAYCDKWKLDLFGAIYEKIEFNKTRKDHTHEERAKEGGKKF